MRKSSLGKRGTAVLPQPLRSVSYMPEEQGHEEHRGRSSKSMIPRPARSRSASADRNSVAVAPLSTMSSRATPSNQMNAALGMITSASTTRGLSMLGKRSNKPRDPRILTDKNFQTLALQKIVEYFSKNTNIDIEGLKKHQITIKQFLDLMIHLFSFFFPKLVLNTVNYTERIPQIMKEIGYPGVVTKSWLLTVNSLHSWPQLIGLISWLVDVIKFIRLEFEENLAFVDDDDETDDNLGSKTMLKYYIDCARRFNKQLSCDKIDAELHQQMINKMGITEQASKRVHEELEHFKNELRNPERIRRVSELNKLKEEISKKKNELRELQQRTHEMGSFKKQRMEEKKRLEEKCEMIETSIVLLEKEIYSKQQQLDMNQCTVTRHKELEKAVHELEQAIKLDEVSFDLWNKESYKYDLKIAALRSNLYEISSEYNILLRKNENLCSDVKDFELKVYHNLQDTTSQMQVIEDCVANYTKDLSETQAKWKESKEEEARLEESRLNLVCENEKGEKDIADLESKIAHLNDLDRKQETMFEEKLRHLKHQIFELSASIPDATTANKKLEKTEETIKAAKQRIRSMQEEAMAFLKEYEEINADFEKSIRGHMQILKDAISEVSSHT